MDCGAYYGNEPNPYVVRIRGSEYSMTEEEFREFYHHLTIVEQGHMESMSNDYLALPEPSAPSGKGISLTGLFGIAKRTLGIVRRI